jgi:hypothetical protein
LTLLWMWISFRWLFVRFERRNLIELIENVFTYSWFEMNLSTIMKSALIDISHIRWILRFDVLHKDSLSHSQKERLDILAVLAFQPDETQRVASNLRHRQRLPNK